MLAAEHHYTTEAPLEPWQLSFYSVLGLHIILALLVTFGPQFTKSKPKFENVYTIDLIELPPTVAPPPPPPKPQVKTPSKEAVSISDPQPIKPTVEAKPISIAPKKKKVKKKIVEKETPKVDKSEAVEQRKRLAEAIRQEELAKQQAEQALKDLEEERKLFESTSQPTTTTQATTSSSVGSNRNSKQMSAVEAQWFAAVKSQILRYWALPEFKQWDPDLTATVVVTIDKSGRIINEYFEQNSGDKVFDQFVRKTLQDASPFPKIPVAMKKHRYELGLNFKPGSIQ